MKVLLATFWNLPDFLICLPFVNLLVGVPLRLRDVVSVLLVLVILLTSSWSEQKKRKRRNKTQFIAVNLAAEII